MLGTSRGATAGSAEAGRAEGFRRMLLSRRRLPVSRYDTDERQPEAGNPYEEVEQSD